MLIAFKNGSVRWKNRFVEFEIYVPLESSEILYLIFKKRCAQKGFSDV